MAPEYKLHYFNLKALGECPRWILSYMEADWEDVRVEPHSDHWNALKPSMPFGKLPVLEVRGERIPQSIAISRYLGAKAGLAGRDEWESLQIDVIVDTLLDMRQPIYSFWFEKDEEKKKASKETYTKETLPFYLKKLDEIVRENSGYLANKKLSWADFLFVVLADLLSFAVDVTDLTEGYPHLHQLKNTVLSIPKIQQWVNKRPNNPY